MTGDRIDVAAVIAERMLRLRRRDSGPAADRGDRAGHRGAPPRRARVGPLRVVGNSDTGSEIPPRPSGANDALVKPSVSRRFFAGQRMRLKAHTAVAEERPVTGRPLPPGVHPSPAHRRDPLPPDLTRRQRLAYPTRAVAALIDHGRSCRHGGHSSHASRIQLSAGKVSTTTPTSVIAPQLLHCSSIGPDGSSARRQRGAAARRRSLRWPTACVDR